MKIKKTERNGKRYKDSAWGRREREYLTTLQGKCDMKHKSNEKTIKVEEIVMVEEEDKQRGSWKIGRINELFVGKYGVIRGVKIKTAKGL